MKLPLRLRYVSSRVKRCSILPMNQDYDEPIRLPTSARGETLTDAIGESMRWHSGGFDGFGGDGGDGGSDILRIWKTNTTDCDNEEHLPVCSVLQVYIDILT